MASSMLAFLRVHFQACLKEGTSAHESGLTVSIKPLPGELILFFELDCNAGRVCLKMLERRGEREQCCDFLIVYTTQISQKEVMCLLELKGKNFLHAVDQVCNTY